MLSVGGTWPWSVLGGHSEDEEEHTDPVSAGEGLRGRARFSPDGFGGQASDGSQCVPIVVR